MAFVSLTEMRAITFSRGPSVTFRNNGIGHITKAVYSSESASKEKPSTIEVEIDSAVKKYVLKLDLDYHKN